MTLKLADFGLAMEVTEPIYTVCGTPTYVAPEILAETGKWSTLLDYDGINSCGTSGYGLEVDMWAAGVITYILLCGFPPFRSVERDQEELFEVIQLGDYEFLSPYWDSISDGQKLSSSSSSSLFLHSHSCQRPNSAPPSGRHKASLYCGTSSRASLDSI